MLTKLLSNKNTIYWFLLFNLAIRALLALTTNLGIDEAYYFSYALFPDWSYFDHPPMVGLLIRLTTWGLTFTHDFFIRLGPLLIGTMNLYIIYRIGEVICDKRTGMVAAILLASSFYGSIVVGTFILPDAPQSIFWLLSILFFIQYISKQKGHFLIFLE